MGVCSVLIWSVVGLAVMASFREQFAEWACRVIRVGWRVRFVVLCVAFAMVEEAVTTGLTNAAPWFGGVTDAARITASKNYFEVVFLNSVVAFVPMFVCWAWMLSRVDFRPAEVSSPFGLNGTLAETLSFGTQNLINVGMWVYVYGPMMYLPAWTVPVERGARRARWWDWPVAVFLPLVFVFVIAGWLVWWCVHWVLGRMR